MSAIWPLVGEAAITFVSLKNATDVMAERLIEFIGSGTVVPTRGVVAVLTTAGVANDASMSTTRAPLGLVHSPAAMSVPRTAIAPIPPASGVGTVAIAVGVAGLVTSNSFTVLF